MSDFDFEPDHGYGKRPPSPPSEESSHRRERIRQILEGAGLADDSPKPEIDRHEDRGRPPSEFEPCGYYDSFDVHGHPRRFTIYRRVGHPRLERVMISGDGYIETMFLVDGERYPDREAAELQLEKVEKAFFGFGSPAMNTLRAGGQIRWVKTEPAFTAGDNEGRPD